MKENKREVELEGKENIMKGKMIGIKIKKEKAARKKRNEKQRQSLLQRKEGNRN